jgi:hypothetical protein
MIMKSYGLLMCGLLVGLAGAGCQSVGTSTTADVLGDEIIPDAAMARRDWPVSVATYANGKVVSDPTLFAYEPRPDLEQQWHYYFADTGAFLASVGRLPFIVFDQKPDSDVTYGGYVMQPSHYAVPALPPARPEPAPWTEDAPETEDAPMIDEMPDPSTGEPAPSDITPAPTTAPAE